jgi:hypothetical protein
MFGSASGCAGSRVEFVAFMRPKEHRGSMNVNH